jgi:hypothetical protein
VVNFGTLLVAGHHLFQIPFKSIRDVMHSKDLLAPVSSKKTRKDAKKPKSDAGMGEARP